MEASRIGGGISIALSGVIGISDYSESEILLKSHGGKIRICGKRLMLSIYEDNTAEIVGRIEEIGFGYGKG
ncbi:MAG: YabP/YqfC family sporulation protein [Clostridia bacterium]|nr:YabP/YqfC family sporulation protein [Clostridia bacterium]